MSTETGAPKEATMNEVIRTSREAAGLSQESVAAAAGTTQSTYSRFELGQANLEVAAIFRIKEFLDPYPVKFLLSAFAEVGGMAKLSDLLHDRFGAVPQGGKLTDHIAKELEERRARQEAARIEREEKQRREEREAKAADFDALMKGEKLTPKTHELLRDHVELRKKFRTLKSVCDEQTKEILDLKEQVARLTGKKLRPTKSRKRK